MTPEERIAALEGQVEELRLIVAKMTEDPTVRSMADGTPRVAWGVGYQSPLDPSLRYALVREAGGNAAFVTRLGLATSDWSDA